MIREGGGGGKKRKEKERKQRDLHARYDDEFSEDWSRIRERKWLAMEIETFSYDWPPPSLLPFLLAPRRTLEFLMNVVTLRAATVPSSPRFRFFTPANLRDTHPPTDLTFVPVNGGTPSTAAENFESRKTCQRLFERSRGRNNHLVFNEEKERGEWNEARNTIKNTIEEGLRETKNRKSRPFLLNHHHPSPPRLSATDHHHHHHHHHRHQHHPWSAQKKRQIHDRSNRPDAESKKN